jgi:hypothetical protein
MRGNQNNRVRPQGLEGIYAVYCFVWVEPRGSGREVVKPQESGYNYNHNKDKTDATAHCR